MFRKVLVGALIALVSPAILWAQYPSQTVTFNGDPGADPPQTINDPTSSYEMFRQPEFSPSTLGYFVPNTVDQSDNNAAFRAQGLQSEGVAALQVFFSWTDPLDPDAWLRLSTFNGPLWPNPSLDTQGKVRFRFQNQGEIDFPFEDGAVGLCIGIRETGAVVPQLANGGTTGDIEWVGVSTALSVIRDGASTNGLDTVVAGDDVLVATNGIEAINWGPNRVLDSIPAGDDVATHGFIINTNGSRTPVPALTVPAFEFSGMWVEWDLSTGVVSTGATLGSLTPQGGGIVGFTGNGVLDAPNNRGTLEHVAIVNVTEGGDDWADMVMAIDTLQFEATMPDPVLPPRVLSPIINDDAQVIVTDLIPTVNRVTLFRNGMPLPPMDVVSDEDVVFDIDPPASTGETFSATQRDSVTGTTSDLSPEVTVLAAPPRYSFSMLVDESGTGSCTFNPPGWEWVGVTSFTTAEGFYWVPQGQPVFTNDAVWQAVDVPLDDNDLVIASLGGNGELAPAPLDAYTLDSIWFTIPPDATSSGLGPWEVFVDAVQLLDSNGMVTETILDMEDGVNRLPANRGQSRTLLTSTALSSAASYDGSTSHRLLWTFGSTDPSQATGVLQRVGGCGTSAEIDDTASAVRFHLLARGPRTNPTVPLPQIVGPIIVGTQDTVRVLHDADAAEIQLYIDGVPTGSPVPTTGTQTDISGLALTPGESVSATQTLDVNPGTNGLSDFAYPRAVTSEPLPPGVQSPLLPGETMVTVTNVTTSAFATATEVTVYVDGVPVLPATPVGTSGVVTVTVPALDPLDQVTATQTVNGVESPQSSPPVIVGVPAPVIYMAPAQGASSVRVTQLDPAVTEVSITVNGSTTFSTPATPGDTHADVPVSGLMMGDTIVATQSVGMAGSAPSVPETVTTNTVTATIWCDDFEYVDQAAFNANWNPITTQMVLSTDENSTPGGQKSAFAPDDASTYRSGVTPQTGETGTDTHPVVFSVNIYDLTAAAGVNQYADLNNLSPDFFLAEIGMTTFAGSPQTHYQARLNGNGGPNWFHLNQFDGPERSVGWHNFTMVFKGPPEGETVGHELDIYVDGLLARKNIPLIEDTNLREPRIGSGQATTAPGYFDDYCARVGPVTFPVLPPPPPAPPTLVSPLEDGDEFVTVTGVVEDASLVTVLSGGVPIGSIVPTGGEDTVDVPVTPLVHLDSITATQENPGGVSPASQALEVGKGNGDILIALGVRDSTSAIEWIKATERLSGAPQGEARSPSNGWVTITFDPASDPILGFTGNGVIDGTTGSIEHLAVSVNSASANRSSGTYRMYVDNVVNVGAGPGDTDVVITDFEGFALGAEVMFQEPTFSGSTDFNLSFPPSASANTDAYNNGGQRSQLLTWFFRDTAQSRWVRITTAAASNLPAPAIDVSKPIRMDILLLEGCATVPGDMDGDCDIDDADTDAFVPCISGPQTSAGPACVCADFNGDGKVDLLDMAEFQASFTDGAPIAGCTP